VRDEHFKFQKVVWRYYSGKVEKGLHYFVKNYSGKNVPNFVSFVEDITKNSLVSFVSDTLYITLHNSFNVA